MRNLFRDALKIYSEQAGLNIIFNKDGCFWRDLDKPVMFSCDWSSSYNTLGTMNTYALYLADGQTIKDWDQFNYHQFGERITPSNFVWLPRLDESWPTSITAQYIRRKKRFFWKKTRVGRGANSPSSQHLTRQEIIEELRAYFSENIDLYSERLCELIQRNAYEFKIGERIQLNSTYGDLEIGRSAIIEQIGTDHLSVRFAEDDKIHTIHHSKLTPLNGPL